MAEEIPFQIPGADLTPAPGVSAFELPRINDSGFPESYASPYVDGTVGVESNFNRNNHDYSPLMNNPGCYFSVFYDPDYNGGNATLKWLPGLILSNSTLYEVGDQSQTKGIAVRGAPAPITSDVDVWLNVDTSDPSSSTVTYKTKESSKDFSLKLARVWGSTGNGYIEQYHSGILSLGGGGGSKFPFRVTIRKEGTAPNISTFAVIDKGGFRDTERKTVPIPQFSSSDTTEVQIVTTGDLPVLLVWEYDWPGKTITYVQLVMDDHPWDGKEIVTPITGEESHGRSKCAIAILEVTRNTSDQSLDAKVKTQLVNTGLRAMWASGYVEGVSGDIGMYAEASIMNPDA